MERENAWLKYNKQELKKLESFCEGYRKFISEAKTERECAKKAIDMAMECGYVTLEEARKKGVRLKPGAKIIAGCQKKTIALFHIGKKPLESGMNILGAHIDSPRLDLKQNPLYEDGGLAYFDTHYYGGIKKYQWVTIPLALHGTVVKSDGTAIDVIIGEDEGEPVLGITDLLIHLAQDQMEKKAKIVIEGEALNILIGSRPLPSKDKEKKSQNKADADRVRDNILKILEAKYGISEEDLISAELEAVPAGPARNFGLDSSMIIGYGHDDRVCAYPSLIAQLNAKDLERTGVCLLVDKEEIGSVGATGMQSMFFENTLAEVMELAGCYSELGLRRALANSMMLSSDVSALYDPIYASVFDKRNAAIMGQGLVFNKYTGSRGKSGSNDASAEYMARIRKIMDDANVSWHTAELGKVDIGGGGTIAYIMAKYGMDVIDSGVGVLCMHSPYEIAGKADIYEALKGYAAFLKYC